MFIVFCVFVAFFVGEVVFLMTPFLMFRLILATYDKVCVGRVWLRFSGSRLV